MGSMGVGPDSTLTDHDMRNHLPSVTGGHHLQPGVARRWSIAAVIPVRTREEFIGRALESVLEQLRQPDEIIVVDDGSTDDTVDVVRSYEPRIRLVQTAHAGVGVARNLGVETAASDFVAFLDSDDFWQLQHLERMSHAMSATDGRADIYFSDCRGRCGTAEEPFGRGLTSQPKHPSNFARMTRSGCSLLYSRL